MLQSLFGALQLPEGIGKMGFPTLAALAALVKHLRRLNADSELVTEAQMVQPPPFPISMQIFKNNTNDLHGLLIQSFKN